MFLNHSPPFRTSILIHLNSCIPEMFKPNQSNLIRTNFSTYLNWYISEKFKTYRLVELRYYDLWQFFLYWKNLLTALVRGSKGPLPLVKPQKFDQFLSIFYDFWDIFNFWKEPGGKVGFEGWGLARYWYSTAPVLRPSVG